MMTDLGVGDSQNTSTKLSAPKDRSCPFCGNAFTSSSLGRHLDSYVRNKNPKAPDGIHDVQEIRKIRSGITRRLQKGSKDELKHPLLVSKSRSRSKARRKLSSQNNYPPQAPVAQAVSKALNNSSSLNHLSQPRATDNTRNNTSKISAQHDTKYMITDIPLSQNSGETQTQQKHNIDDRRRLVEALDIARNADVALRKALGLSEHNV